MEDILGVLYGAHDDGHLGLGGDLEDAGAEVVELAVPAGVALGEDGNADLVLANHLDALEDGFQGLPVILPVDQLAHQPVHDLADEEHIRILPLGDEGQLGFREAAQQQHGV